MIRLKGEALIPKMWKEDIDFVFEPQRENERDNFGSGLLFQVQVGPKGLILLGSLLANLIIGTLNFVTRIVWG